jgi:hypothetical protein
MNQSWEYRIVQTGYMKDREKNLNALGQQGWELIEIHGTGAYDDVAYFVRPI